MSRIRAALPCAAALAALLAAGPLAPGASGQAVTAGSVGLGATSLIEFENSGGAGIDSFRLWLEPGASFRSFTAERGWEGARTPEGVLVFTAPQPVGPGHVVKFGLKTDFERPGINWRAFDAGGAQLGSGKTLTGDLQPLGGPAEEPEAPPDGVLPGSEFRIIPREPAVGSTVRVAGDGFGRGQPLEFYMDDRQLGSFESGGGGSFVFTTRIPDDAPADRVDFAVRDAAGNEKTFSLRIDPVPEERVPEVQAELAILTLPQSVYRGEAVRVEGTGHPGGSITATVTGPGGDAVTTARAEIGADGTWTYEASVPVDAPLGQYTAAVTDGRSELVRTLTVESDQRINVAPTKLVFEPGEAMRFNGTAIAGEPLEVVIEDPLGAEVFAETVQADASGFVSFGIGTEASDPEGTYVVFASHEEHTAIILAGLGELPTEQLLVRSDKLNYRSGQTAHLAIEGPPSGVITLLVVNPSDQTVFSESVALGQDGKAEYALELAQYRSGVYTIILTRGNAQTEHAFSVGLETGSGAVDIQTTKTEYLPGDPILVIGRSGPNILLTVTLADSSGADVKARELFTDKEGRITVDTFSVPRDAASGTWSMRAQSGANVDVAEFNVISEAADGIAIIVEGIGDVDGLDGEALRFRVLGATHTLTVSFHAPGGGEIGDGIRLPGISDDHSSIWEIPEGLAAGTYTIRATDGVNSADAEFEYGQPEG